MHLSLQWDFTFTGARSLWLYAYPYPPYPGKCRRKVYCGKTENAAMQTEEFELEKWEIGQIGHNSRYIICRLLVSQIRTLILAYLCAANGLWTMKRASCPPPERGTCINASNHSIWAHLEFTPIITKLHHGFKYGRSDYLPLPGKGTGKRVRLMCYKSQAKWVPSILPDLTRIR